jgi:hypothetical protein
VIHISDMAWDAAARSERLRRRGPAAHRDGSDRGQRSQAHLAGITQLTADPWTKSSSATRRQADQGVVTGLTQVRGVVELERQSRAWSTYAISVGQDSRRPRDAVKKAKKSSAGAVDRPRAAADFVASATAKTRSTFFLRCIMWDSFEGE